MKIALFANRFPSVSETFVADQVEGLLRSGHHVDLYARPPLRQRGTRLPAAAAQANLGLRHWPRLGLLDTRLTPWLAGAAERDRLSALLRTSATDLPLAEVLRRARWVGGRRYDAIVAHFGPQGLTAQLLRDTGSLHGPLAVFFHGFDITRLPRARGADMYAPLLARAEALLPVSERFRAALIELGAAPERVHVQRMGVDLQQHRFTPRTWQPGEPLRVLSVARLVEKKGLHVGVEALAHLARQRPELRWDIVGEGPLRAELEAQIRRSGAPARLLGTQSRAEVAAHLARSHILLAPSLTASDGDQEGVPVAIMEAMASGAVVVSTQHSGIPEVVDSGTSGFLAREGDADSLVEAMLQCCEARARWGEIGTRARTFAEQVLDRSHLHSQLERRLQALAGSSADPVTRASCAEPESRRANSALGRA